MRSRSARLCSLLVGALLLAGLLPASASAQVLPARTWVDADAGSDSNDCSFDTPCTSFTRAHQMTASYGEINVKSPGEYSALTITKPITIDGGGTTATIAPYAAGVVVDLPSDAGRVVLRNLSINVGANEGGVGIVVRSGANVLLDDVDVIGGSEAGIHVNNSSGLVRLIVDDTKVQGSAGPGVLLAPGSNVVRATIRDSRIDDNGGPGLKAQPTAGGVVRATVRRTDFDANFNGVVAESARGGTATVNLLGSAISDSGIDGLSDPGIGVYSSGASSIVRISRNEIQHNRRGLQAVSGGSILSTGDNDIFGNVVNGAPTGAFGRL